MTPTPAVLIVEDDPVFRRVMSFTVAAFGLRVETAADGQQGFERVAQGGIDFLVTDLQMPVCTGLRLIERLDESDTVTRPPTILCTAKGLEIDTVDLIRQMNLVAIMHKPFSPRKLGALILQQFPAPAAREPSSVGPLASDHDMSLAPFDQPRTPHQGLSAGASTDG